MNAVPKTIRRDDLSGPEIHALLEEHLANMRQLSPPESVHALDLSGLRRPEISFWTLWSDAGQLMGCGALKMLDATHGEIKSMRTAMAHRRKGVARAMLQHILAEAAARGMARLSLETGSQPAFEPARSLYARFGFLECAPFADYVPDPNSVFMTRLIAGAEQGRRHNPFMTETPSETVDPAQPRPELPDRLSVDPRSPHHLAAVFEHEVGIRLNGKERFDVQEYCISERWVKVPAGKTLDRKGQPLLIVLKGAVEAFYRTP